MLHDCRQILTEGVRHLPIQSFEDRISIGRSWAPAGAKNTPSNFDLWVAREIRRYIPIPHGPKPLN